MGTGENTDKNGATENGGIQAVIFDLDGVLLDSEWSAFEAWKDVARHFGGALEDSAFYRLMGTAQEVTAQIIMEETGIRFPMEEACEMAWKLSIERLRAGVSPLPGSKELVEALAARNYPLAIASNSLARYVDTAIDGLKLGQYFPVRACVDQVPRGKPAPDLYLEAAERLGVEPARCLAVEDSRVGVSSAVAAGMRVIAVPDRYDENPHSGYEAAWRRYTTLVEVYQTVDEILSAPLGGEKSEA